jgi:hypothetical protein
MTTARTHHHLASTITGWLRCPRSSVCENAHWARATGPAGLAFNTPSCFRREHLALYAPSRSCEFLLRISATMSIAQRLTPTVLSIAPHSSSVAPTARPNVDEPHTRIGQEGYSYLAAADSCRFPRASLRTRTEVHDTSGLMKPLGQGHSEGGDIRAASRRRVLTHPSFAGDRMLRSVPDPSGSVRFSGFLLHLSGLEALRHRCSPGHRVIFLSSYHRRSSTTPRRGPVGTTAAGNGTIRRPAPDLRFASVIRAVALTCRPPFFRRICAHSSRRNRIGERGTNAQGSRFHPRPERRRFRPSGVLIPGCDCRCGSPRTAQRIG